MFPGHPGGIRPPPGLGGHGMDPMAHYQQMLLYAHVAARDMEMKAEMEKHVQNQRNLREQQQQQQREREREQKEQQQREVSIRFTRSEVAAA